MDKVDVEIDIEDELLFKLMLEAHKRDITFNQLAEEIIRKEIDKKSKEEYMTI